MGRGRGCYGSKSEVTSLLSQEAEEGDAHTRETTWWTTWIYGYDRFGTGYNTICYMLGRYEYDDEVGYCWIQGSKGGKGRNFELGRFDDLDRSFVMFCRFRPQRPCACCAML
jgi:hypothetical protein